MSEQRRIFAIPGLGLLPGSNSVHHDGEPHRRPRYLDAVREREVAAGWGVDDGVGLLFAGTRLAEVVASRPRGRAHRVEPAPCGGVVETPLVPRLLPGAERGEPSSAVTELRRVRATRRGHLAGRGSARFGP